jgi:hypothetical protein
MAKKGGARPGAGRPKGSGIKPFRDYVSDKDKADFVEFILGAYMSDMRLAQWFGNQLFGQAPQSIDHTTMGEKLPTPILGVQSDHGSTPDTETQ